jgi:hypothetical protein
MATRIPKNHPDYRPKSYWRGGDPIKCVLTGIRDTNEREEVLANWKSGNLQDKDGAFLGAVSIVSILLESVNGDVITLEAVPLPDGRIKLVWQDNYGSAFTQPFDTADQPLTLGEMIRFIEASSQGVGFILPLCYTQYNFENDPEMTIDELMDFTDLESGFYPGLANWFFEILSEWICSLG